MNILIENYLNELFGFGDPSRNIINEVFDELNKSITKANNVTCIKYKGNDTKQFLCEYNEILKAEIKAENEINKRASECKNNKNCLNVLSMNLMSIQSTIRQLQTEIKKLRSKK